MAKTPLDEGKAPLDDADQRKCGNFVTILTMISTVNALLFGAALTALFAGSPPNPAISLPSCDAATPLVNSSHPYGILWGLTASLNLTALFCCLLFGFWVTFCGDQEELAVMYNSSWLPAVLSGLAAGVAYASLVYSCFLVYGTITGLVALVPSSTMGLGSTLCILRSCYPNVSSLLKKKKRRSVHSPGP